MEMYAYTYEIIKYDLTKRRNIANGIDHLARRIFSSLKFFEILLSRNIR